MLEVLVSGLFAPGEDSEVQGRISLSRRVLFSLDSASHERWRFFCSNGFLLVLVVLSVVFLSIAKSGQFSLKQTGFAKLRIFK